MNLPVAKKKLGQHWLTDKPSLQAIVNEAHIESGDTVLEIGPGTGTLTDELLRSGAEVTALEYDSERIKELEQRFKNHIPQQIKILHGDIRSYSLDNLPSRYKIVANIPYYLTANLLRILIDDAHKPLMAVLLVQKELAERVSAKAGNYSLIAVLVQIYYEVKLGELVPAFLFTPPPKVDSQVLVLQLRSEPLIKPTEELILVVKAGFTEKRKKLKSSLSKGLAIDKAKSELLLTSAQIDINKRAQELTIHEWEKLALAYSAL